MTDGSRQVSRARARRLQIAALVMAATLALVAASCGGDDDGDADAGPQDPADLEGRDWLVTQLVDDDGQTVIVDFGISAAFDGSTVSGVVSCNSYSAPYETDGGELSIGTIGASLAMCPSSEQEIADRYLELLGEAATFVVEGAGGGSMYLSDAEGTPIVQFE